VESESESESELELESSSSAESASVAKAETEGTTQLLVESRGEGTTQLIVESRGEGTTQLLVESRGEGCSEDKTEVKAGGYAEAETSGESSLSTESSMPDFSHLPIVTREDIAEDALGNNAVLYIVQSREREFTPPLVQGLLGLGLQLGRVPQEWWHPEFRADRFLMLRASCRSDLDT